MHTIRESGQLDVVIIRGAHNEFLPLAILAVADLNDVNAVDDSAVDLDKPNIPYLVGCEIYPEPVLGKVP